MQPATIILRARLLEKAVTCNRGFSVVYYVQWAIFTDLLECQNYQAITNNNGRKNTYVTINVYCDSTLGPGWFRFQEATGTKMPTSCVPTNRCNTHAPGWLNGAHPTVADGQVTRQVRFHYFSNCCNWSINIKVRNCGGYFIYYFNGTPAEHPCSLRFCSSDWNRLHRENDCSTYFLWPCLHRFYINIKHSKLSSKVWHRENVECS